MINSELREYCEGVISNYSLDYPYYFMHTNTSTNGNYYQQYGVDICLSKTKPSVNSQNSMTSDEWLVVTVYSANANSNDNSPRVVTSTKQGTVTCNEFEYIYSNVSSIYAYSSVDTYSPYPYYVGNNGGMVTSIIICACLIAGVVSIWLRK